MLLYLSIVFLKLKHTHEINGLSVWFKHYFFVS